MRECVSFERAGCTLENQGFFSDARRVGNNCARTYYQLCLLVVMDLYGDKERACACDTFSSSSTTFYYYFFLGHFLVFSLVSRDTRVNYPRCLSVYIYIFFIVYIYILITLNQYVLFALFVGFNTNRLPRFANWVADFHFLLYSSFFFYYSAFTSRSSRICECVCAGSMHQRIRAMAFFFISYKHLAIYMKRLRLWFFGPISQRSLGSVFFFYYFFIIFI